MSHNRIHNFNAGPAALPTSVLEEVQGHEVILEEIGAREFIPLDTVMCSDSGTFEL